MSEVREHDVGSSFEYYSVGIAAEDVSFDGKLHRITLKVIPVEKAYNFDGDLTEQDEAMAVDIVDSRGVPQNARSVKNNYVVAVWLPIYNTNRSSPPDICKGQTVMLYKQKNKDIYYWADMFFEPSLKRTEHVDWMYRNFPNQEPDVPSYDEEDFYRAWVSTKLKTLGVTTSKSDGESVKWSFQVNLNYRYMKMSEYIHSQRGNIFQMDYFYDTLLVGTRGAINVVTGEEFAIQLNEDWSEEEEGLDEVEVTRHKRLEAKNQKVTPPSTDVEEAKYIIKFSKDDGLEIKTVQKVSVFTPNDIEFEAGGNYSITATDVGITAQSITIVNSDGEPMMSIEDGKITVSSDLYVEGDIYLEGKIKDLSSDPTVGQG